MATKMIVKTIKRGYTISVSHVSAPDAKSSKRVLNSTFDVRAKHEDEVQAFALAIRDATAHAGILDHASINADNPVTAIVNFPDQSFAYIAINLSDTQCPLCGSPEGIYNEWCPKCQERKRDDANRGNGNKASALFAALDAKDTRRGRN